MNRGALAVCLSLAFALTPAAALAEAPVEDEREVLRAAEATALAHGRADELAETDPARAADILGAALQGVFPKGPRGRALRADLFARRSELLLAAGEGRGALEAARAGLAEGASSPPTAFTALLHLREGAALEALGKDEQAVLAYEKVIAIAKQLLAKPKEQGP